MGQKMFWRNMGEWLVLLSKSSKIITVMLTSGKITLGLFQQVDA